MRGSKGLIPYVKTVITVKLAKGCRDILIAANCTSQMHSPKSLEPTI